ncbi:MAG: cupin domain-containing protein [Clostridia bacterium]|nr:cupin domain-containing protein [Clostridia bacterium]
MNNFKKINLTNEARQELHDQLGLTGAEISVNSLPAGTSIPFVHSHKQNEEIYAILEGEGSVVIDGENICIKAGDWVRISPSAKRQFFASKQSKLKYICIQVKANSLEGYTMTDAIVL